MSPLLNSVVDAGIRGVRLKSHPWQISPRDFYTDSEHARGLFAQLINARADNICIVPSVSYGISLASRILPIHPSQTILVLEEQFPSNVYAWQALAKRSGSDVQFVSRQSGETWTEALVAKLQHTDAAIVSIPHCHWTDGALIDLKVVREISRQKQACLVLDTTQSLGALPLDIQEIQPDVLVTAGYKWMLGPYSLGFMYVDNAYLENEPLEYSWITRKNSENFDALVEYQDDYQPGARRYDMGERSNFTLMPMAIAALEQIHDWGVQRIQTTLSEYTRNIEILVREMGLVADSIPDRAGHFLGVRFPDGLPADMQARMRANDIYISIRGDSMRVTPHLYNDAEDFEKLEAVLKSLK